MSEGSVYQRKDGRWVAKYSDARGRWRYVYRKTRAEARKALREALRDRDEGIVPPDKMTVGALLDDWLADYQDAVSRRTWLNRESIVRVHIKPHLGAKRLVRLSPTDIRTLYRDKLAEVLKPSTVKRVHVILKGALREAVRRKYIRRNPASDVAPPKVSTPEMRVPTAEQVKQLLAAARGDRLEAVFVLGATCGLGVGECLSLRYEDIDFERGVLRVRRTLWNSNVYQPKTPHSRRTIKLPRIALDALYRHAAESASTEGWLFPTSGGNPVAVSAFWRWSWKPMLRKAGLPETTRYHDLRHTCASIMLGQNVPLPVVSSVLGHANPNITAALYSHMLENMSGWGADGMDDALGQPRSGSGPTSSREDGAVRGSGRVRYVQRSRS